MINLNRTSIKREKEKSDQIEISDVRTALQIEEDKEKEVVEILRNKLKITKDDLLKYIDSL